MTVQGTLKMFARFMGLALQAMPGHAGHDRASISPEFPFSRESQRDLCIEFAFTF